MEKQNGLCSHLDQNFPPRPLPTIEFEYSLQIVHKWCCLTDPFPSLQIVHKWCCLTDPFPANHCSAFFNSAPFPALSILTIFLDKCQMKSLEDINILIRVKLFCLKNSFFEKKKILKIKMNPERFFFWKENFCMDKNFFLEKILFRKKKIFLKKFSEKIFFLLWHLKVLVPKCSGE